jgi:hypothetical protein
MCFFSVPWTSAGFIAVNIFSPRHRPADALFRPGKLKTIAKERDKGGAGRRALCRALPVDGEEQKVLLLGHRESYFTIIGHPSNLALGDRSVSAEAMEFA